MLAREPCREKAVAVGFIDLLVLRRQCFESVVELYTEAALKPFIDARIAKERERLNALITSKVMSWLEVFLWARFNLMLSTFVCP
jgi:hypothetical protein